MAEKPRKLLQNARYFLQEELGQGSFGIAYKAWDGELNQYVVIKTLREKPRNDASFIKHVERFKQEGQRLIQLGIDPHDHIVGASRLFEEDGIPYLVMDFIEGQDLWERVESQGALRELEAVKYICQIGEALSKVHQAGLVHRDAHPGNIILCPDRKAVLVDFGLVGEIVPTRKTYDHYAHGLFAPYEQKLGSREPTVDIYALAATLYFAVTRQFPPPADDRKYRDVPLDPPQRYASLSDTAIQAILKGMAVEAKDRPSSIQEWLKMLRGEVAPADQALQPRKSTITNQPYYISRKPAEDFLGRFAKALKEPETHPLLFHVYGFGGVGKTTLTKQLKEAYEQKADIAEVSFRLTSGLTRDIETPLKLMAKLYKQLPPDLLEPDPFTLLDDQYHQTVHKLTTQPIKGESVEAEQLNTVRDWVELGSLTLLSAASSVNSSALGSFDGFGKAEGMLGDAPQASASAKERMQQLLQQHPATKNDRELQSLILEPIPKLTQAFAEALIERTKKQKRPVILVLDTYEQALPDIDTWLWQYLLEDTALQSYPIRLVVAGRRSLLEPGKEGWRKLQQDRDLIDERQLTAFDKDQTKTYLQKIGISKPQEIQKIYKVTKGLPYYLDWIRREKEGGRDIDFSRGNQAIVELLLQGLKEPKQKEIVKLAACCRWFDRSLIEHLLKQQAIDIQATDATGYFDWLRQCDFVEYAQGRYRLDDVARDVFRRSLSLENKEQFRQIHERLASYFEQKANQEVPPDSPAPEKYENPDWCQYTAEFLYHGLFARKDDGQRQFLSHLFASRYLKEIEVVISPFAAVAAETAVENYRLLPSPTEKFLKSIKLVFPFGWVMLAADPAKYKINYENGSDPSKEQIEAGLKPCFIQVDLIDDGLGKYAGLLYKSLRCRTHDQRVDLLLRAKEQAERIATATYPEFSASLFGKVGIGLGKSGCHEEALASFDKALELQPEFYIAWGNRGNALFNLERYEEAIASFDKALEIKPDSHNAWNNRGNALFNLERYEEAIASFDKALEIKPDSHDAWNNRGSALGNLGRYEEAIASFDKALEIKPDSHDAWNNRGSALGDLGRYEEAIASFDKALEFKPDFHDAWRNRGVALENLGCYEEAIASFDKALEFKPDSHDAWNNRGSALGGLGRYEEAIASFDKAVEFKPDFHGAWRNRGSALGDLGRYEEAIASYDKALKIKPDGPDALSYRGLSLSRLGRYDEAVSNHDEALKLQPEFPLWWANRGIVLARSGRYEEALASCDKALELQPNDESGYYGKACCYVLQGDVELAIANLQQAIHLNPDRCRREAKTNLDFDSIREDDRFQALIQDGSDG
jgi:tetratricopeptide (TPR) repeat protein